MPSCDEWDGTHSYQIPLSCGFERNKYPAQIPDFHSFVLQPQFQHPDHNKDFIQVTRTIPTMQKPTPPSIPPETDDCAYVSGTTFHLEQISQYPWGICYITDFDASPQARATRKALLDKVIPNPEFTVGELNGDGVFNRVIPGFTSMIPGIPYSIRQTGLPPHLEVHPLATLETRVKFDTWASVKAFPGSELLLSSLHVIEKALWGDPESNDKPLWENNLLRNQRSGQGNVEHPFDGSYSLGITLENCGRGFLGKAKQVGDSRHHWRNNQIINHLDAAAGYLFPRSILPHELSLRKSLTKVNNAACVGANKLFSNVQLNYSTGTQSLGDTIGKLQGSIHTDPNDSVIGHTMFVLWVRFPKGTALNAGAFMFAQTGVYLQDDELTTQFPATTRPNTEVRLFIAIFKGNEPHSGFAPILKDGLHHQAQEFLTATDALIERVGLVCYLSHKAIERADSKMAVFPPGSMFGSTSDDASARPLISTKCSSTDYLLLAPDRLDHINWHLRDAVYALNTHCNSLGIQLNGDTLSRILDSGRVIDRDGNWSVINPACNPPLDILLADREDAELIRLRGEIQWYIEHCERSNLRVQRGKLKKDRAKRKLVLAHAPEICAAIAQFAAHSAGSGAEPLPILLISKLNSILWDSAAQSVIYNVETEDGNKMELRNEHHHFILSSHPNNMLLLEYLAKFLPHAHLTRPTAPTTRKRAASQASLDSHAGNVNKQSRNDVNEAVLDQEEHLCSSPYGDSFNKQFIDSIISSGLDLSSTDDSKMIEAVMTALDDNITGCFHNHFHSLRVFAAKGNSSQAGLQEWLSESAINNLFHSLAPAQSEPINTISHVNRIGAILRAYTYEEKKHSVTSRISRWLAMAGMSSLYNCITAPSALPQIAREIAAMIMQCHHDASVQAENGNHSCTCNPLYASFVALAHHNLCYLQTSPVTWKSHMVPQQIVLDLLQCLKIDSRPLTIWTDSRFGRTRPPPKFSTQKLARVEAELSLLIQLQLEQILILPHVTSLLLVSGANLPINNGSTKSVEEIIQLRRHFIAVGSICAHLEKAFGNSVIFSYTCNGNWVSLLKSPAHFFFSLKDCSGMRSTSLLAGAVLKDANSVFKPMLEYIAKELHRPITIDELLIASDAESLDAMTLVAEEEEEPERNNEEVGFVLTKHLLNRSEKLLHALSVLECNRRKQPLPPLQLRPSSRLFTESQLSWRLKSSRPVNILSTELIANVYLGAYIATVRASERLYNLLSLSSISENTVHHLLWNFKQSDLALYIGTHEKWYEFVKMMLLGNFANKEGKRDRDQTMPLRSYFRSTALFKSIVNCEKKRLALTSGVGIGFILYFFLTGQSSTTREFTSAVDFPTSPMDITDVLFNWDTESGSKPFENIVLYGQANSLLTFVVKANTDIENEEHCERVSTRLAYFFSQSMQHDWLTVLGPLANRDFLSPGLEKLKFEVMLQFLRHLHIVYGIGGLGSGLLPLQVTNTLVEMGLVEHAELTTIGDFVGQTPTLGAARALQTLGFPFDKANPASISLAFQALYMHMKRILDNSGSQMRFLPSDHEHLLCKTSRSIRRWEEANKVGGKEKLEDWARSWSPDDFQDFSLDGIGCLRRNINEQILRRDL